MRPTGDRAMLPSSPPTALEVAYFDQERTHFVRCRVEPHERRVRVVVEERPFGSREPRDVVRRVETHDAVWEARLAIRDLEARLALTGARYLRITAPGAPPEYVPHLGARALDHRPHLAPFPGDASHAVSFAHFRRDGGTSVLRLAVPRLDLPGERFVLADCQFEGVDVARGLLDVVHGSLSRGTLRQRWVDAHVDLPRDGFRKLVDTADYVIAFGELWHDVQQGAWRAVFDRLVAGDLGKPAAPAVRDDEPRLLAPDVVAALASPLVRGLFARYLRDGDEERLVRGGEAWIERHVEQRRREAAQDEQFPISVLETALRVRHHLEADDWNAAEREGRKLVRMMKEHAAPARPAAPPATTARTPARGVDLRISVEGRSVDEREPPPSSP